MDLLQSPAKAQRLVVHLASLQTLLLVCSEAPLVTPVEACLGEAQLALSLDRALEHKVSDFEDPQRSPNLSQRNCMS